MNEKEIQQAFIQFLAQKYQLKSQQELEAKIQELGENGLKAEYAEFQKVITQQQSRKMMFGAKLNYIKGLKGQCPQGYEMKYYKDGGIVCSKCEAIKQQAPMNLIDAFKCGRRMKKKACGGKVKKAQDGIELLEVTTTTKTPTKKKNRNTVVSHVDEYGNFMGNDSIAANKKFIISKFPNNQITYFNRAQGSNMVVDPSNPQWGDYYGLFRKTWDKNRGRRTDSPFIVTD